MNALYVAVVCLSAAPTPGPRVDAVFHKVAPAEPAAGRSPGQRCAVVLIHGLGLHPINKEKAVKAALRTWQRPDSPLVKALSQNADVYAFAYGQSAAVERIGTATGLAGHVSGLRKAGYRDVILVGHSAGGLIARILVEDQPDAGVTKVIQVCTPNTGSFLASWKTARDVQRTFLFSLSPTARKACLAGRQDRRIPAGVQFACVIAGTRIGGDGIVSRSSQWSDDLQKQGIPAHLLRAAHWESVKIASAVELIGRLVREPQPRWKPDQVTQARKKLLAGWGFGSKP
jgi:pimeloyl-ACP methyl ester carboxylesterase